MNKESSFLMHNSLPFISTLCIVLRVDEPPCQLPWWQTPESSPVSLTRWTKAVPHGNKDANYWTSGSFQHLPPTIHLSPTFQAEWAHLMGLENKARFPLSKPLTEDTSVIHAQGTASSWASRNGYLCYLIQCKFYVSRVILCLKEKQSQKGWEKAERVPFCYHTI